MIQHLVQDSAYDSKLTSLLFSIWSRTQSTIKNDQCTIQRLVQDSAKVSKLTSLRFSVCYKIWRTRVVQKVLSLIGFLSFIPGIF